jgi:hypothetical protein
MVWALPFVVICRCFYWKEKQVGLKWIYLTRIIIISKRFSKPFGHRATINEKI